MVYRLQQVVQGHSSGLLVMDDVQGNTTLTILPYLPVIISEI